MKKKTSTNFLDLLPKSMRSKIIHLPEVDMYIAVVDPTTLNDNPKNWRIHTQRQKTTFNAFKSKYGWLGFVSYNVRLSHLLDGHMRVSEAIKNGEDWVPVILKDLNEQEENEVLATFDNIGLMAKRNDEALKSLTEGNKKALSSIKTEQDRKLAQLNKDLAELTESETSQVLLPQSSKRLRPVKPSPPEDNEEAEDEAEETVYVPKTQDAVIETIINDDMLFEGSNWLGIPDLVPSQLATPDLAPVRTFCKDRYGIDAYYCISCAPFEDEIGTLGFYTEDWRFEDAYRDGATFAEYLQELDPVAVISPDFSTYHAWPAALKIYSIYRSRWCARLWQSLGFQVIPSIQWADNYEITKKYVLETLPQCPVVSFQLRRMGTGKDKNNESFIKLVKHTVQIVKPELVLLYGGEEKQRYLHGYMPKGTEFRYLPQYITEKRKKLKRAK